MRRPEFVARQGRRPEGWFGQLLALFMAWETRRENDAALRLLDIRPGDRVLEIGFGHGRSIAAAAKLTRGGLVTGVDFSPAMVRMARRRNRRGVIAGLVDLREADSTRLPFNNATFEKAYSVHTLYFWAAPIAHLQEARRVLKAGGRFVLGFRPEDEQARRHFPASVYTFRPADQTRQMLMAAGFRSVDIVNGGVAARGITFAVASTEGLD
jgi:SAM-dependent methyltransferase